MARTMEQVLADVSKQSDPQRQLILKQISDLPTQQQADEAGLEAQKNKGFNDIMLSARRRNVAYWGAPIAEQQSYLATNYLPAAAKLKQSYNDRSTSLESALNNIGANDYTLANNIFNQDRSFEEQQRQFNENLALQRQQLALQQKAQDQANANAYLAAQNQSANSEREAALRAEIEKQRPPLLAIQNYAPGYSASKQPSIYGLMLPNF